MTTHLFDLDGRVAIVTGASGWLGRAIVGCLLDAGADVLAVARDEERLAASLAHRSDEPGLTLRACDVTSDAWPELLAALAEERGRIDVLVNNAHVGRGGSLRTSGREELVEAVDLALAATTQAINAARPGFAGAVAAGGSPSVVNIASMYGVVAPDPRMYDAEGKRNPPYYGAAKAALLQLTRYAAAELGPEGVRVNAITPGPFPGPAAHGDAAFVGRLADRTMLGRVGRPEELQTAVLYLASPHSSFVTGSNLVVDGGWTAW